MYIPQYGLALLALCLLCCSPACGVGGISQSTGGAAQSGTGTQQQPSVQTQNTTGAAQPPDAGSTTASTGATTAPSTPTAGVATTTGQPPTGGTTSSTAGGTAGGTAGSTAGATAGTTTQGTTGGLPIGQDGNAKLFDLATVSQATCLYDSIKRSFALTLSNDAQYCAHATGGVRIKESHVLSMSGKLAKPATGAVAGGASNPNAPSSSPGALLQPESVQASMSLYTSTCALQNQATAAGGAVTFTQADFSGCSGTFTLVLVPTVPPPGGQPVTLTGTFSQAQPCLALAAPAKDGICQ